MAKKHIAAKIGITVFQALTKSKLLDKQYDELGEKERRNKIKSEFKGLYVYSPVGGHSGEVLVGYIDDVQFDITDDFIMRIKSYKLDKNGKFKDNGFLTLSKEDAIKGRLYDSKSKLLEFVLDQIKNKGISLGSFHLTQLGILNHLIGLMTDYFEGSRLENNMRDVVGLLTVEKERSFKENDTIIRDNVINSLLQISLNTINNPNVSSEGDKYFIMDFTTHAISLLMGSKYREIIKKM